MHFCLIRHADAVSIESTARHDDSQRALSERGLAECRVLTAALQKAGIQLGTVVSSPYLRALQTAEKVLESWPEPRPSLLLCDHLAPAGEVKKLCRFLHALETDVVTLVGHMPDLAVFGSWLIGSKKAQLTLAKSGAAWIESETGPQKGCGVLNWLLTPQWFQILTQTGSKTPGTPSAG
jgi:phosphohistidine phosphatase